jgi:hypothetical protein
MGLTSSCKHVRDPSWLVAALTGDRFELLARAGLGDLAALLSAHFGAGELA